mgnify:CR=1 FL=1|tara:strand:+ start:91 stop:372 length:282 start_codon:yes stop_codon:yes gene_type:complete
MFGENMNKIIKRPFPKVKVTRELIKTGDVVEIRPFRPSKLMKMPFEKYQGELGIVVDLEGSSPFMFDILLFNGVHIRIRREMIRLKKDRSKHG